MNPFAAQWQNYYVIVGSASAALIGIQFVVITLVANLRTSPSHETVSAFGTPTVFHFASALVVSALMTAPWSSPVPAAIALASYGCVGVIYSLIVLRRARRQKGYQPVWEDWLWYVIVPCLTYSALLITAGLLPSDGEITLFGIGACALSLLLLGVRNAWDTVTHIVIVESPGKGDST